MNERDEYNWEHSQNSIEDIANKNGITIVNYQFKRDGKTENISPSDGLQNKPKENSKPSHLRTYGKSENTGKDTSNMTDKGPKLENGRHFQKQFTHPRETSFITKEFKTTFFDDLLESNPYLEHPKSANNETFGCSYDCLGTKLPDIFEFPMENEFVSLIPIQNTSEVRYMAPKCCSTSFQGIPYRNQGCGILQAEPKKFPMNPDNKMSNICCSINHPSVDPDYEKFKEMYCRRYQDEANLIQNDTSCVRNFECCNCKKSNGENEKITSTKDEYSCCKPRNQNKKRHFTCCKSGKVDEEELCKNPIRKEFVCPELCSIRMDPNPQCCQRTRYIKIPNQELHPNKQDEKKFGCSKECPLRMRPEKEYPLIYTQQLPTTKSVACESKDTQVPHEFSENKTGDGKNITIQIIPNCCQNAASPDINNKTFNPPKNCCQDVPFIIKNDYPNTVRCHHFEYQPCVPNIGPPICCNDPGQYQRYPKEKPFSKWWSCNWRSKRSKTPYQRTYTIGTRDCCTTTCEETNDEVCEMVNISNCQRVLPIRNTYINREENFLKSLHRLNKGLVRDLFATPCPSSSSACQNACVRKIRGASFPMCLSDNLTCHAAKPRTANQCCQFDSGCGRNCSEPTTSCQSSKDILCECLKYLKKGLMNENHCEYVEEDCCGCCCQHFNSCCCCQRAPKCCETMEIPPKIEEKKSKSCRCRSVEAKQSSKNCGTIVSNHCFTKVETVCTNTEIRPKTPKPIRKKRICCKRRCCCCCTKPRNCCCCCCDPCCHSDPCCYNEPSCCQNVRRTCCKSEHFVYCCQCHSNPVFQLNPRSDVEETSLKKCIDYLTNKIKVAVSKETTDISVKENINAKSSEQSNTTEKSTNTSFPAKSTPITKDALIKILTLDLCDLNDKKFSKFAVPSLQYPWGDNSFFLDMPQEIYRFVGIEQFENALLEKAYDDPTPCLRPQILHENEEKNEQNAGGDIEKVCEVKKRYLSTICEAFFDKNHPHKNLSILIAKKEINTIEKSSSCDDVERKNEKLVMDDNTEDMQTPITETVESEIIQKSRPTEISTKSTSKTSQNSSKIPLNVTKKSSNASKLSVNSSKISSNVSKTSSNVSGNYTSKPFTTKTGLMSFIPSFRDSYKSSPPIKKMKQKLKTEKNPKIMKTSNKPDTEQKSPRTVRNSISKENPSTISETYNEKTEVENENIKLTISTDHNELNMKKEEIKIQEGPKKIQEIIPEQISNEERIEPFDLNKFNQEMHAFYNKCFKNPNIATAEKIIPFYNTSVSDIIKSLESRSSISSSPAAPERIESTPSVKLPMDRCNDITFPVKTNTELYSEAFQRSYESNNMNIPNKIMSKSDLISLN